MKHFIIYIAIVLIFISCKREIDINIPNKPSVLVIDAALFNDSFITVNLSRTQNITDNSEKKYVNDAVIEVFNKDTSILDVLQLKSKGQYVSNTLKAESKEQYLFKISYNGNTYWSKEQIPDSLKCIIQDTSRIIFSGKSGFFQFNIRIEDKGLQNNYYGIKVKRYFDQINGSDTQHLSEWSLIQTVDVILTEDPQSKFSNKHILFKDNYFDGAVQFIKFGISDAFSKSNQKTTMIELYVSSYSENAYHYYSSINEHLFYQNDPFSQPTLIKGNIANAYGGIVAEYMQMYQLKFK